jgi:hypothetical protein
MSPSTFKFEIPTDGCKMDAGLDKSFVKCDLCSEFLPLVGGGRSTTHLKDIGIAKSAKLFEITAEVSLVFVNSFFRIGYLPSLQ